MANPKTEITEKELQHLIEQTLTLCGWLVIYTHKIGAYKHKPITPGLPDLLAFKGPPLQVAAIEVKRPPYKQKPLHKASKTEQAQIALLGKLEQLGVISLITDNLDEVIKRLGLPITG